MFPAEEAEAPTIATARFIDLFPHALQLIQNSFSDPDDGKPTIDFPPFDAGEADSVDCE